jgi:nicotinamidase/pyrazinamidase
MRVNLQPHDALIVVDVQRDFLPGGALGVPQGDQVVPVLNRYIALVNRKHLPVFASRDWHPADHCSFTARGGPWPPHCVAGTQGAQIAPGLDLPADAVVVDKATSAEADAYSAFSGTILAHELRARGVKRVLVGGLATDYCVLNTVRDALKEGFEVVLLTDAISAVDVNAGDGARAEVEMRERGAQPAVYADTVE